VHAGMPAASDGRECAEMLRLQVDGKRDVVEGRFQEGFRKMRDSWIQFQKSKETFAREAGDRILQFSG
jgi:hypothetical protein